MKLYLDDSALLLLASEDPGREVLLDRLAESVRESGATIFTGVPALAHVQQRFLAAEAGPVGLREFWNALNGLFKEILPLRGEDLGRALDFFEAQAVREDCAVHAALMDAHAIEYVVAVPERRPIYNRVPGIKAFEF